MDLFKIIEIVENKESPEEIKEFLKSLKNINGSKKELAIKLEELGNKFLSRALDLNSHLSVRNISPEEREKLKKEVELNLEKARILLSAPYFLKN